MPWYERVASALRDRGVKNAAVGRMLGVSGQSITLKLQGKRPVTVDELKVLAREAGMSVAQAVGDDAVVIDLKDELDLIELFRLLTPDQQKMILGVIKGMVSPGPNKEGK